MTRVGKPFQGFFIEYGFDFGLALLYAPAL